VCRSSRISGNTSAARTGPAVTRSCKAAMSRYKVTILLSTRRSDMPFPFLHEQDDPLRVALRTSQRRAGDAALDGLAPTIQGFEHDLLKRGPAIQHGPHRRP